METISLRDWLDEKFQTVNQKLDATMGKQDLTNGRVRSAEVAIAVLMWAYGVGAVAIGWIVYKLP